MKKTHDTNMEDSGLLSFDPIVLVLDVARRWLIVLLLAVFVGVGTFIFSDLSYKPVYQSNITFVVTSRGSSATVFNNLSSTSNVAAVFTDLLNSSMMRKSILAELGTDSFNGTISASVVSETNLLNVKVTASDPRTAFTVARAVIEHHEDLTYQVVEGVSMEVLLNPSVPVAPINRSGATEKMRKMMLLAAAAAIVLLGYYSFSRNTVRSYREASSKLDCSCLGQIAHEKKYRTFGSFVKKKKTSILITSPVTGFRFVESVRKLRHRIENRMREGKVLMVTSIMENEGKSTVAVNLALSMAQKKERVLLIDCDLRKPACMNILENRSFQNTVTDVITGKAEPEAALLKDRGSNLSLMLAKRGNTRSGDLIASEGMANLIDWARANFDFVVLDLPPMGEVSDAETMTRYADGSLLVVRQNIVSAQTINKAVDILERGDAKLLGCVLNNVYSSTLASGQGYGYGGYGHYGKYGNYHSKTASKK